MHIDTIFLLKKMSTNKIQCASSTDDHCAQRPKVELTYKHSACNECSSKENGAKCLQCDTNANQSMVNSSKQTLVDLHDKLERSLKQSEG